MQHFYGLLHQMRISESLKQRIESIVDDLRQGHNPRYCCDMLILHIERELDKLLESEKDELKQLRQLRSEVNHIKERLNMIPNDIIEATKTALNDATQNIINHLPGNTTPSTPDAAVQGLIDNVNANVNAMNAAAGPVTPPTP